MFKMSVPKYRSYTKTGFQFGLGTGLTKVPTLHTRQNVSCGSSKRFFFSRFAKVICDGLPGLLVTAQETFHLW
jgi:hypothetical protein